MQTLTTSYPNNYSEKIDLVSFYEIVDHQEPLILNLLRILHKNLLDYPIQMKQDLQNHDFLALAELAHKFKSSTAYVGLSQFNHVLNLIEYALPNRAEPAQIAEWTNFIVKACPIIAGQIEQKIREMST